MGVRRVETASLSPLRKKKKRGPGGGKGGVLQKTEGQGSALKQGCWAHAVAAGQELALLLPPPAGSLSPSIFFSPKPKGIPNKATVDRGEQGQGRRNLG